MTRPTIVTGTIHPGSESGTCFRTNRSCRLPPAHQGMKSGSCGLVQRIGTAVSATPHPDPSGGQAPALHFLNPPSTIGLQSGTFRPWRTGIEVDWRAHPGSESGTCFRTKIGCIGWQERESSSGVVAPVRGFLCSVADLGAHKGRLYSDICPWSYRRIAYPPSRSANPQDMRRRTLIKIQRRPILFAEPPARFRRQRRKQCHVQ